MKWTRLALLMALAVAAMGASQAAAQNLLANPGFEDPVVDLPPPFTGRWHPFNGGGGAFAVSDALMPRTGAGDLHLGIPNSNNNFAGAFQDVVGLTPGHVVTTNGWHKSASDPLGYVSEFRIEWRNSVTATEVTRTQILPVATVDYTPFAIVAPVPAGADTARVVYAIQTFTDASGGNTGDLFLDDMSLTVVIPEPATLAMAGLAGLSLLAIRRRQS